MCPHINSINQGMPVIIIFGQNLAIPTILSDLPLNEGKIGRMSLEFITVVCEVCIEQKICKQIECLEGICCIYSLMNMRQLHIFFYQTNT